MTIIEGQVGSLKCLKEALLESGVTRFTSIREIRGFLKSYETKKAEIPSHVGDEIEQQIHLAESELKNYREARREVTKTIRNGAEQQISALEKEISEIRTTRKSRSFAGVFASVRILFLSNRVSRIERNAEREIRNATKNASKKISMLAGDRQYLIDNKKKIASQRCEQRLQSMIHTKEVVDGLYTLVAGAIGESAVVNHLQKLSDDYYLINDFSVNFDPPIYNKKSADRIHSVQIDHLLISRSGLFVIETKNWSKASVQSFDLRSPVEQIKRTSFALFVMLNGDLHGTDLKLSGHHWGEKKIPIRNVIAMTNEKPSEQFKYVKVLSPDELVGYVQYFEQTFDSEEVKSIYEFLRSRMYH